MFARILGLLIFVAVPVVGILWLGWDWREVVLLYWLENVTVGVVTVISMLRSPRLTDAGRTPITFNGSSRPAPRFGLVLFFMAHYGIFTLVHGVFVLLMVRGVFGMYAGKPPALDAAPIDLGGILLTWGVGSVVQIVLACIAPRDGLAAVGTLFSSPYRRIIVLHVTVLGGAWLISRLDWPAAAALLLVALHFALDLRSALGERDRMG